MSALTWPCGCALTEPRSGRWRSKSATLLGLVMPTTAKLDNVRGLHRSRYEFSGGPCWRHPCRVSLLGRSGCLELFPKVSNLHGLRLLRLLRVSLVCHCRAKEETPRRVAYVSDAAELFLPTLQVNQFCSTQPQDTTAISHRVVCQFITCSLLVQLRVEVLIHHVLDRIRVNRLFAAQRLNEIFGPIGGDVLYLLLGGPRNLEIAPQATSGQKDTTTHKNSDLCAPRSSHAHARFDHGAR